jgi:hypothetical protein
LLSLLHLLRSGIGLIADLVVVAANAPIVAATGPMPAHQRLRPDDRDGVENRGKPAVQLDEEKAVTVGELDTAANLRCSTITFCRAAFSASSRPAGLKGDSSSLRRNHGSATIVRRYAILPLEQY